ncbi:MAG: FkbM family methyltransferase [Verrucomicrobiae bacterium]|nr:FkbM family methyltransferase [Verrucomicrobiae bacterium]
MATLSNRIFNRLQTLLYVPLLVLGRMARVCPARWLCSLNQVCCRVFGTRVARFLDGSFFNVALLDRPVIRHMNGAELQCWVPYQMEYNAAEYIQRVAPLFGLDGPLAAVPMCLDHASVLFDIGANLGTVTVPAALRLRQPRRIHAFEPNPKARTQLLVNLKRNGVEAVVNEIALSDREGDAELHVELGDSGGGSLIKDVDRGRRIHRMERHRPETFRVRTTTLDAYVRGLPVSERSSWGNVIIKVDVEGFEASVLDGGARFLEEEKLPLLLIVETMGFNIPCVPDLLLSKGFVLVEECLPRLFRRLASVPEGRVVDLYFLKNVREVDAGVFEWPLPK